MHVIYSSAGLHGWPARPAVQAIWRIKNIAEWANFVRNGVKRSDLTYFIAERTMIMILLTSWIRSKYLRRRTVFSMRRHHLTEDLVRLRGPCIHYHIVAETLAHWPFLSFSWTAETSDVSQMAHQFCISALWSVHPRKPRTLSIFNGEYFFKWTARIAVSCTINAIFERWALWTNCRNIQWRYVCGIKFYKLYSLFTLRKPRFPLILLEYLQ